MASIAISTLGNLDCTGATLRHPFKLRKNLGQVIIPLREISHVQFAQADAGIFLKNGKTHWLRGKLLTYVFAWLYARGMPSQPTSADWVLREGHGMLTTTFFSGILQRHGVLAFGEDVAVFLPLGSISLSLGSWPLLLSVGSGSCFLGLGSWVLVWS